MNARRISSETGVVTVVTCWAVAALASFTGAVRAQILVEPVPTFEDVRVFGSNVLTRPHGVVAADFDLDGYPDIAVAARGLESGTVGSLVVFRNLGVDGTGAWLGLDAPDVYFLDTQVDTKPYSLAAANLNSIDDLIGYPAIVISASKTDEVFVYLNDGSGRSYLRRHPS